ncbi:MAG: GntR family transcriptional regulator [Archangiaceae bacterium]|nr:GntR family transcriptional regulator [Archangiaceae bacterium]
MSDAPFAVETLEQQLVLGVICGEYRPGDYLPPLSHLAHLARCSPEAVRAAVGRLLARGALVHEPGRGLKVSELMEGVDLELLLQLIRGKSDAERALELELQLLDLMSLFLLEVAYRAAATRTEQHLKWFHHHLRALLDRAELDTHVKHLATAQFELMRVLASAGGGVAFTALLSAFRGYLCSEAALELMPPDVWERMGTALAERDVTAARQLVQLAFDRRIARVLELLARVRGLDGGSNPPTVELMEWGG